MKLISSYPRSGSAKLRFILCYLLYPEVKHDFETMSKYIPSIDNEQTRQDALKGDFMVTHSKISSDIYLYRHVGDCLVSEYWFKKKFYGITMSIDRFIRESNYGEEWRLSVDAGRGSKIKISFDDLDSPYTLHKLGLVEGATITDYSNAISKASFTNMKRLEDTKGFYYLPDGDKTIPYMRSGKSGQFEKLHCAQKLSRLNDSFLTYLKLAYYDENLKRYVRGVR